MPGIIEDIITGAPLSARVAVVGVCMGADQFRPSIAILKEIDVRFVLGVDNAFDALGDPEAHAKILIDPKSDATSPARG